MSILEINDITKKYGEYTAVNNVSFKVTEGHIYGVLGPNGAGKTTTIRMIMNIIAPDSGSIMLFGQTMKVLDMLVFLGELHGMVVSAAKEKALIWLEKLQLIDNKNNRVDELSKGMQQKLQIIGAIMHDPDLIILDEPFSGLDPVNVNLIKNIMLDLRSRGKAIMFSTHMMDAAEKLCDEVLMINKGNKVLDGKLSEILKEYGKNSVHIEFNGNGKIFDNLESVEKVDHYANYVEVDMKDGHSASGLLKQLVDKIEVTSMQTSRSSLNEIFISLAGGN